MLPFRICLGSAIAGRIVDNGNPVVGAAVERVCNLAWNGKDYRQQVATDADGCFRLPRLSIWSYLRFIPAQPVVEQTITVRHDGREFNGWHGVQMGYEPGSELASFGRGVHEPIQVSCDLAAEIEHENRSQVYFITGIFLVDLQGKNFVIESKEESMA